MKCPQGDGKRTIEENFRNAVQKSKYIIFDLRRIKLSEKLSLSQLKREFEARPYLKRLYIIRKNGELMVLPEKNPQKP